MTGANFQVSAGHRPGRIQPQSERRRPRPRRPRGLFQFIEQTWLATLKEQGTALGYGRYANAIARQPSGRYAVADPRMTAAIMNLRSDPTANSVMAGAFTRVNAGKLAERLGRDADRGRTLHRAFPRARTGASRLIGAGRSQARRRRAAAIFPGAARANPSIFYDGRGQAAQRRRGLSRRWSAATTWRAATPPPGAAPRMIAAGDGKRTAAQRVRARHRGADRDLRRCGAAGVARRASRSGPGVPRAVPQQRRASRSRRWSVRCGLAAAATHTTAARGQRQTAG